MARDEKGIIEEVRLLEDRVEIQGADRVGSGRLGDVFVVQDKLSDGKAAVKAISLRRLHDTGTDEACIRQEIQVMSELQHPNIVQLIDVVFSTSQLRGARSEPPYICIVMEYVDASEPLSKIIKRRGQQPLQGLLVLQVISQLASALAHMHTRGLVHRDVWSENVLVNEQGHVVLVDFGSAEYVQAEPAMHGSQNLPYMSPEAARGAPPRIGDDAWALGLLITEITTGLFIHERMGRTDRPLHFNRAALTEAITDAVSRCSVSRGKLCKGLLELDVERRLIMADVLAECEGSTSASLTQQPHPPPSCSTPRAVRFRTSVPLLGDAATSPKLQHRPLKTSGSAISLGETSRIHRISLGLTDQVAPVGLREPPKNAGIASGHGEQVATSSVGLSETAKNQRISLGPTDQCNSASPTSRTSRNHRISLGPSEQRLGTARLCSPIGKPPKPAQSSPLATRRKSSGNDKSSGIETAMPACEHAAVPGQRPASPRRCSRLSSPPVMVNSSRDCPANSPVLQARTLRDFPVGSPAQQMRGLGDFSAATNLRNNPAGSGVLRSNSRDCVASSPVQQLRGSPVQQLRNVPAGDCPASSPVQQLRGSPVQQLRDGDCPACSLVQQLRGSPVQLLRDVPLGSPVQQMRGLQEGLSLTSPSLTGRGREQSAACAFGGSIVAGGSLKLSVPQPTPQAVPLVHAPPQMQTARTSQVPFPVGFPGKLPQPSVCVVPAPKASITITTRRGSSGCYPVLPSTDLVFAPCIGHNMIA